MPSPWTHELEFNHQHFPIDRDQETEVTIVGAGIAGISTAFFVLENTKCDLILLESYKVAHGATGHNAGQVVGYFERPFNNLAEEYGLPLAINAQNEILQGWKLIDEILKTTQIKINYEKFWGWAGCQNLEELIPLLENDYLRNISGIDINDCYIDKDWQDLKHIPEHLHKTFKLVDKQFILDKLNTDNPNYIACLGTQKGVLNSSLFCEKVLNYLLTKYTDRFKVFEHSKVEQINITQTSSKLTIKPFGDSVEKSINSHFEIISEKVILCTNGFKNFKIDLDSHPDFEKRFKQNLSGLIGFMAGYLQSDNLDPTAITYFLPELEDGTEEHAPYFYLTRRNYKNQTLTCIGGPDLLLEKDQHFDRHKDYSNQETFKVINFLHKYYKYTQPEINFDFKWQGLMGYTENMLRMIGPEPRNPRLLYNLGCNGIGILPSIYGGYKISQFLQGKKMGKSLFDPKI
jgi:hypothetical protein